MSNNSISWDKSQIVALIALVVAVLTLVATFTVPEIRVFFGLEKKTASPLSEVVPSTVQYPQPEQLEVREKIVEIAVPSGPARYTISESQPQFIEAAQTNLSVVFHDVLGEKVASLTIAPAGKASSTHAVLAGYTQEFTSSAGAFLVQILHVDYEGKNIEIQVTKNREFSSDDKESSN
ncbi:hypothetical protein KKHLCK_07225 [Candidatus Electrothrix laxa]